MKNFQNQIKKECNPFNLITLIIYCLPIIILLLVMLVLILTVSKKNNFELIN